MTGLSIHQSTSHQLTITLSLTEEVVANTLKITHAYSFLIFWGFTIYSWFWGVFSFTVQECENVQQRHDRACVQVYNSGRLKYRGFSYQHWSCHDSAETTRQGRQTDYFYYLESLSTFCLLKHFDDLKKKQLQACKDKKKHMGRDYSTDEIVIL